MTRKFRQGRDGPLTAISFLVDDAAACVKVISISRAVPNSIEHLLRRMRGNATKTTASLAHKVHSE
jgi:hypothetical protein